MFNEKSTPVFLLVFLEDLKFLKDNILFQLLIYEHHFFSEYDKKKAGKMCNSAK